MKFFNLGLAEIIFIVILAFIILGPRNIVKTARDLGNLLRRVTRSPYWQEVWATRRELSELPKILAREAQIDETLKDLDLQTRGIQSSVANSVSNFVREVEEPLKKADRELADESSILNRTSARPSQEQEIKD